MAAKDADMLTVLDGLGGSRESGEVPPLDSLTKSVSVTEVARDIVAPVPSEVANAPASRCDRHRSPRTAVRGGVLRRAHTPAQAETFRQAIQLLQERTVGHA